MNLEIKVPINRIDIFGFEAVPLNPENREVYLDGKRAPKTLEEIILLGIDAMAARYLDSVEEEMASK
jgi:hypothetical protein